MHKAKENPLSLDLFSDEILMRIFKFLSLQELMSISQTCRRLQGISVDLELWTPLLSTLIKASQENMISLDEIDGNLNQVEKNYRIPKDINPANIYSFLKEYNHRKYRDNIDSETLARLTYLSKAISRVVENLEKENPVVVQLDDALEMHRQSLSSMSKTIREALSTKIYYIHSIILICALMSGLLYSMFVGIDAFKRPEMEKLDQGRCEHNRVVFNLWLNKLEDFIKKFTSHLNHIPIASILLGIVLGSMLRVITDFAEYKLMPIKLLEYLQAPDLLQGIFNRKNMRTLLTTASLRLLDILFISGGAILLKKLMSIPRTISIDDFLTITGSCERYNNSAQYHFDFSAAQVLYDQRATDMAITSCFSGFMLAYSFLFFFYLIFHYSKSTLNYHRARSHLNTYNNPTLFDSENPQRKLLSPDDSELESYTVAADEPSTSDAALMNVI